MTQYIHHVPGRLRVKTLYLKRNETKAAEVCRFLAGIAGVVACDVNTLTGSIVISYDTSLTSAEMLLGWLADQGYVTQAARSGNKAFKQKQNHTLSNLGGNVGKAVIGFAVEKAFEHSAIALIGAIL
jgi:hypothetical protein